MSQITTDLDYWVRKLQDQERCVFPVLNDGVIGASHEEQRMDVKAPQLCLLDALCRQHDLKLLTLFQTAWILVLRSYTNSDEVCFGVQEGSSGSLPYHVNVVRESGMKHVFDSVESSFARDLSHRCSLKVIDAALKLGEEGLFNTSIRYTDNTSRPTVGSTNGSYSISKTDDEDVREEGADRDGDHLESRISIEVSITVEVEMVSVGLRYCHAKLSPGQATNVASALERALECVLSGVDQNIGQQSLFSDHHQRQVKQWNLKRPDTTDLTLHDAIYPQVLSQPDAPAIDAWDEKWTYREMDELSSGLARHLVMIGVVPGMKVPLVFERSGWWVIALLAVSKSGAAFVPVDPTQPVFRLKETLSDVKPEFLLTSEKYAELLADSVKTTIVVSRKTLQKMSTPANIAVVLPVVSPLSEAYVMYTSGSTGKPKGAVLPHGGYLAALLVWQEGTSLGPKSRVLQQSSYAWSVCIIETIIGLWFGACLCIPSDYSKQNELTQVFEDMHITWAIMSPSIGKTIQRESVRHLESLTLCGEPVSQEVVAVWASEKTKVWVNWAATECLTFCSPEFTATSNVQNLGMCKAVCRITEVGNPDKQVPIGSVGEIVVHAPWMANGYLNDPERTAATFLDRPDWLEGGLSSYGSRFYRVGDLVRQNSDGSLMLAGRGDNMIKIRGQRFDMSEVERNLGIDARVRNSLPIISRVGLCKHRLVAVVALHESASIETSSDTELILLKDSELKSAASWVSEFRGMLAERIPSYMIPTIWVLVKQFPLTITGKIDRVSLKRFIEKMDVETYENISSLGTTPEPPITDMEKRLQEVWSQVLKLPRDKIGRNQSFISLGGDSILGMLVGARCNDANLNLNVQDVLKYGTIAELALRTTGKEDTNRLDDGFDKLCISIKEKLPQVGVSNLEDVEDAYPSSPMQQGMLLSKARLIGDYNTSTIYEVVSKKSGHTPDVQLLKSAWQQVVNKHAVLRTFFVESVSQSGSFDQVVLKNHEIETSTTVWRNIEATTTEEIIQAFNDRQPEPYANFQPPHNLMVMQISSGKLFCRLNAEHTLVDGMSLAVIVREILMAYDGCLKVPEVHTYSSYIACIQQVKCSVDNKYWKTYLDGMNPCLLPNLTYSLSREPTKAEARSLTVEIRNSHHLLKFCQSQELTLSALFRTVWGLILRAYTGLDQVAFGYITSGRDLPVAGIGEIVGAFINMLVCRMDLSETNLVKDIIAKAQSDYLSSLPHQHASLAQIQHLLGLYGQQLFNTSMTILKDVPLVGGEDPSIHFKNIHEWSPNEYDVDLQVWVSKTNVKMELWYRTESISTEHARNIAATFSQALEAIADDPDQRVGQLDLFSEHHKRQIWDWNAQYPDIIDTCLHDIISDQAARRPQEIAIHSWERKMTFSQLDAYSGHLAHHLVSLGVGPEIHVLLCSEKSALAIVAMLAVLKAGGVAVSIDPAHPIQRLQRIIKDTAPLCCLISVLHRELFQDEGLRDLVKHVIPVDEALFATKPAYNSSTKPCTIVQPDNAAFVLFTSGSTGVPKGIIHTHSTIASSLHAHGNAMNIGTDSRTLQFSAFIFDVSITEIFMALTRGGVLCIPSDHERMNNLEAAITRTSANWAHLTPTVASLLDPGKVPTLKHMALAGEPLKKVNVTEWAEHLELVNLYGPAECALATTLRVGLVKEDRPDNIGRSVGLLVWIVDASNTDRLVPTGAVGELLLEGPNVGRGYLKDKERTLASFIENPAWLKGERTIPPRRFYRSGDLGRYNGDGSIQILGRIDTQVKLHGQRVELGEIEYQVKIGLADQSLVNLAVVYAKSAEHPGGGLLATFLEFEEKSTEVNRDQLMLSIPQILRKALVGLDTHLAENLPSYMVPSIYVPLNAMPLLTAGKIDRGRLSRIVKSLPTEAVAIYSLAEYQEEKVMPRTRMERTLHKLWAKSLNIDARSIGVDDNFFRLGADSVVAMRLSAAGREHGITVTVANIFQNPKLSDMAKVAKPLSERVLQELETRYKIPRTLVQELYPATPLQEGLLVLSNMQPGSYVVQHILSLAPGTDVKRLRAAWEIVYQRHAILRTRIIHVERTIGSMQAVLNDSIPWQMATSLEDYLSEDKKLPMDYGEPLSRYAIVDEMNESRQTFVFTAHHSVFDKWSLSSLFHDVATSYHSIDLELQRPVVADSISFRSFAELVFNMDVSAAESFWRTQLSDLVFSPYPKLPAGHQPLASSSLNYSISLRKPDNQFSSMEITLRAAWALLLGQYSDTPENIVFGMTLDGRGDSGTGDEIDQIVGPTFATVPVRTSIDTQTTIVSYLSTVLEQAQATKRWSNLGLQNIKDLSRDAAKACDFQTLLAIHPLDTRSGSSDNLYQSISVHDAASTYLLLLECQVTEQGVDIAAQYDPEVISASQMQRMVQQFEHVVGQLITGSSSTQRLNEIDFCSPRDHEDISSWNENVPLPLDTCIHEVIATFASTHPDAPAVVSKDGNLSYGELDAKSTQLAHYLVTHFNIGPESLVPLCFAKSIFVVIAMLAVLKAGGGYVPMDPTHPASRLQEIVTATKASVVLCSPQYEELGRTLAERSFTVSSKTFDMFKSVNATANTTVNPDNTCYVIFTSGSTGKPKGVVMTHSGFATAAAAQGKRLNLNSESRVIHFSSYAFEACILEILTTLFNGGCVCVASNSERMEDITKTMRELRVNWAFFTPSFIRTIHPDQVPDLKTLVLGGEALGADNIDIWVDRVFLVNGYGPSETCVFSVINESVRRDYTTPDMIGSAIGGACWIVDPVDHTRLVPLGAVGELLIEGPTLARGYLDDPTKTNEVFVDNSMLLRQTPTPNGMLHNGNGANGASNRYNGANGHGTNGNGTSNGSSNGTGNNNTNGHGTNETSTSNGNGTQKRRMMYKTGDLVRYDTSGTADGTIRFVGRKDNQVKVRGQRMELGDIEYHLKSNLKSIQHVAVEQVELTGRDNRYLAAFFSLQGQAHSFGNAPTTLLSMSADLKRSIVAAEAVLSEKLPLYMIPTLFVPLSAMPLLSSGKTNRRELREMSTRLSSKQIERYSLADEQKRAPSTETEKKLAELWAQILHLDVQTEVGLDDSFFRLGGDSIGAMHLTTLARENGLSVTVAKIFKHPRLEEMAAAALKLSDLVETISEPFSLLSKVDDADTTLSKLYERYQIPQGAIEDAFPTSALQEGLFLLSIKQPGSYMSQITLTLRPDVDLDHFKATWQETADRNSILRTRFAHTGTHSVQFVVKQRIAWGTGSDLGVYLTQDKKTQMDHGGPLIRYAILNSGEERYFVLTAHHSLYDGWSLMLVMEDFNRLYKDGPIKAPAPSYHNFIKYLMGTDQEAAKAFWLSQFSGKSLASYPEPRTVTQAAVETQIFKYTSTHRPVGSDITLSAVIRAAWALVIGKYADTTDPFFGAISAGRNASLSNIERMTGPTITTMPVCISIDANEPAIEFLHRTQNQATDMIEFEQTGLQTIKSFGPDAEMACNFQNLLVIQPEGSEDMNSEVWKEKVLFAKGEMVTMTYALIVECRLYKDKVRITAQYRDHIIPTPQMHRMIDQFEHVMNLLNNATSNGQTVGEIEMISETDKSEILAWNKGTHYEPVKKCVHHVFEEQVVRNPRSPAVESWDASWTYQVLDAMATNLAQYLKSYGIGHGDYVPLCFEKSAWTIVAILGVLKAGAAYLSLDPKHPKSRKDHIIQDVAAKIILTTSTYSDDFESATHTAVVVDQALMVQLLNLDNSDSEAGGSGDAVFVVFTSGSTGVPKGIVMSHGAFVSSATEHSKALSINAKSRVMQFANYTYDVSMGEILTTLMVGGCVCVPSEEQRMGNLAGAINDLRVNWIFLTPTVAGFLKPSEVPGLKTLVLGGEHATAENFSTWAERLNLINSYGPAECAIWCCRAPNVKLGADPASLGRPVGATLWITEATNPDKLAAIGCVGELLVEGPTLAREYLNDPKKTAAAFIENPKWSIDGSGKHRRIYRTGDLVRYGPAGELLFVGRRDTQTKIHGQRIELGEIEHHLVKCGPSTWFPIVDILRFPDGERDITLAAFIHIRDEPPASKASDEALLQMNETMYEDFNKLRKDLEQSLPSHMVPRAFIPVLNLPLTAGGKVDRKALRAIGEQLDEQQLLPYLLSGQSDIRVPTNDMERKLQILWSQVLRLSTENIGLDSNFLRLGGDSVGAMRLSAAAREADLLLSIKSIFTSPKLEDMSKVTTQILPNSGKQKTYMPFSTLGLRDVPNFLETIIRPRISDRTDNIEDVLEASSYQQWTQGCGQLKTRGYNNYFILHIRGPLDTNTLQAACRKLLERHPVLRTAFVPYREKLFQVVLKRQAADIEHHNLADTEGVPQSLIDHDLQRPVVFGEPIIRFLLSNQGQDGYRLMIRISHSLYDGISLPIIVRDLKAAYFGEELSSSFPYHQFVSGISQTMKISEAENFWQLQLEGSTMTRFVNHRGPTYSNPVNKSIKRTVAAPNTENSGITFASIVKAAWSLVLAKLSGTSDVTFGQITTGRSAPIQGIDEIVGPCMNLVPVRVKVDAASTLSQLLQHVQTQHLDMLPYENLGMQHIIEKCTTWPKWTRYSSILQHTNFNVGMDALDMWGDIEMRLGNFTPEHDVSDVWIWTGPSGDNYSVDFTYSSNTMSDTVAKEMLDLLCANILKLSNTPGASLEPFLSKMEPQLPLPMARKSSAVEVAPIGSVEKQAVVEKIWAGIYGGDADVLPANVTDTTPFFDIRGDILAAGQLSMEFGKQGHRISPEEVIDHPTMQLQAALLSLRV